MTERPDHRQRRTPVDIFRSHNAAPYSALAVGAADRLPSDLTGVLVVLQTLRAASFEDRAGDPWAASVAQFTADLDRLDDVVQAALLVRRVQFTEPLRMADLLPGLLLAAHRYPGRALRLVELGSCAGLLLAPEAYRIDYPQASWAPPGAGAHLVSDLDVPPDVLRSALPVADRLGLDLAPVDPRHPGTYDHLRSFAWAGDPAREPRLAAALMAIAPDPPPVARADVCEALPDVLAERVHPDAVTVVIESGLSTYLSGRQLLVLGSCLDAAASRGPLLLIMRSAHDVSTDDLRNGIALVDLSRRWRSRYAATDLLSERTRWTASRTLAELVS